MFMKNIIRTGMVLQAAAIFAGTICLPAIAANENPSQEERRYLIKGSDINVPADVPVGQYIRETRPFNNWTLICDNNLKTKQKTCNVTQAIIDNDGNNVFSWSLAASENGKPFLILRLPSSAGQKATITLNIPDGGAAVSVPIKDCSAKWCIGYQQVGPRLRTAVSKGFDINISYAGVSPPDNVSFKAPLAGMAAALAAI